MLHDADQIVFADRVVDGAAAALLDDLDHQVGRLIDRHRTFAIAQHIGEAFSSEAWIPAARRQDDVGRIAGSTIRLDGL